MLYKKVLGILKGAGGLRSRVSPILWKLFCELLMVDRRKGLIAINEHIGDAQSSNI